MKISERLIAGEQQLKALRQLVAAGEGIQLEFKRKAAFPDKIVKEIIAFANTSGGKLLVGVNDNGELSGLKYPEEESLVIRKALKLHCRPAIIYRETLIPLSGKKFVVVFDIPQSNRRPHLFRTGQNQGEAYIRVRDMSMKASLEMTEIVERGKHKRNIQFTYGSHESDLIKYLEQNRQITLLQFQNLTGLDRFQAARKLVTLVLADVLKITPTEKGDLYSRIG